MNLLHCSAVSRKPNETMRLIVTTFVGVVLGFFIGVSFPSLSLTKVHRLRILCLVYIHVLHIFYFFIIKMMGHFSLCKFCS